MYHLVRTRSQHFVNSPRKVSSPLKHKHAVINPRQPGKRRRLGSTTYVPNRAIYTSDNEILDETSRSDTTQNHPAVTVLNPEAGSQTANRSKPKKQDDHPKTMSPVQKPNKLVHGIFALSDPDETASPKKRKRSDFQEDFQGETGSWIETDDEDEEEPEFIAESKFVFIYETMVETFYRRSTPTRRCTCVRFASSEKSRAHTAMESRRDVDGRRRC